MTIIQRPDEMTALACDARRQGKRVALVPTMGYLHQGHMAHLTAVRPHVDMLVTSIFVNPTQFAPAEDLDAYPRDRERDVALLQRAGCDVLFAPDPQEIYPEGYATYVVVEGITERYEGVHRPTHFRGVTTVVAKLLNIVSPDMVTLGRKDAQQAAVLRRMIRDLNIASDVVLIDTVREPDGLAMSSRNIYLSEWDRRVARTIPESLRHARAAREGGASIVETTRILRASLSREVVFDYADLVDPETFLPADESVRPALAIVAGRVGRTRLIDNMEV